MSILSIFRKNTDPIESIGIGQVEELANENLSLYDKYGGQETVDAVVEDFYGRVLRDPSLAPVFSGMNMDRLKKHQSRFMSQVLGGPKKYEGRSMFEAHKNLMLAESQFNAVAGHLTATLESLNVDSQDIGKIIDQVAQLKGEIVMNHFQRWLRGG